MINKMRFGWNRCFVVHTISLRFIENRKHQNGWVHGFVLFIPNIILTVHRESMSCALSANRDNDDNDINSHMNS